MRSKMASNPMKPARPVSPAGSPMKKGGRACMAAGGVAKVRHNQATKAGAPKAPKGRFKGPVI